MRNWRRVEIFHSGDEYYRSLRTALAQARRSITIETYIFSVDSFTEQILNDLAQARQRGVDVKIVVDGVGSFLWLPQLKAFCEKARLDLKVFHPLPPMYSWLFNYFWRLGKYFKHFNRRTHRKVTIIDDEKAYLGSLNFTAHHVGPQAWRDTGLCLEGEEISRLIVAFHISYLRTMHRGLLALLARFQWNPVLDPRESRVRLNTTQRLRRVLYRDLLSRLNGAQKRILITTAYFLPKRAILRALIRAAKRGVDVRVLIPGKSDVPLVKWAAFNLVNLLRRRGVRLYEYRKSILHAKSMIIDDIALVGSLNVNYRSFVHDLEVEVILDDPDSLRNMLEQWGKDLENSQEMTLQDYTATSFFARVFYKLAFRLRYML